MGFGVFTVVMWVLMGLAFLGIQLAPCGDFILGDEDCPALGFVLMFGILAIVWGIGLLAALVTGISTGIANMVYGRPVQRTNGAS